MLGKIESFDKINREHQGRIERSFIFQLEKNPMAFFNLKMNFTYEREKWVAKPLYRVQLVRVKPN